MTPADSKDWWLAAAALTSAITTTPALAADTPDAGVITSAVTTLRSEGTATSGTNVVLGDHVRPGERFATGPDGYTHILFLDQSSVTLGPNTILTLDVFNHDAATRSGKIAMTLSQGSMRVVGGQNSKTNETEVRTPHGTVGILGGITMVETNSQQTSGTFLFGQQMRVTDGNGNSQTVTRPGFGVTSGPQGVNPPSRIPVLDLSNLLNRLDNRFQNNQPPQAPAPAPSGGASGQIPGSTLAPDRLSNPNSTLVGASMSGNRPDSVTTTNSPPPVGNVRTQPPAFAS